MSTVSYALFFSCIDDDNLFPKDLSEIINGEDYDDRSADSYEERQFHQRSLHSSSHSPPLTISAQTRQALIDLFQKAYDKGWRPNLKHHIPATRFGRHRWWSTAILLRDGFFSFSCACTHAYPRRNMERILPEESSCCCYFYCYSCYLSSLEKEKTNTSFFCLSDPVEMVLILERRRHETVYSSSKWIKLFLFFVI